MKTIKTPDFLSKQAASARRGLILFFLGLAMAAGPPKASAQLFENLNAFGTRPDVGDPTLDAPRREGPKGIAEADFDEDGNPDLAVSNLDGSITVLLGNGSGRFSAPVHLQTGAVTLRGIIAADLDDDGDPDIAAAAPAEGFVALFMNEGGAFGKARNLETWEGARDLIDGDFDGDGLRDLVVAGPDGEGTGFRQFRGTGKGEFEPVGTGAGFHSQGSPYALNFRPVHAMKVIRSRDGLRDDLVMTTADSQRAWIFGSKQPEFPKGGAYLDPTQQRDPGDLSIAENSPLMITEFMALNRFGLTDADGDRPDWIEIYNRSDTSVDLAGWHLTDKSDIPDQWTFPAMSLEPGRFLLVFASSKNRFNPAELHTNFRLSGSGEYLALVDPGGAIAHQFGAAYPLQYDDVSFGVTQGGELSHFELPSPAWENNGGIDNLNRIIARESLPSNPPILTMTPIFETGSNWSYLDDGSDQGTAWRDWAYDDSSWASGPSPLGYSDSQIVTELSFGPDPIHKHMTTYFRKHLTITDLHQFDKFLISLQRDDGAVVYVNGTEILRSQMPPGPVDFETGASGSNGEDTIYEYEVDASVFTEGENVIALELHQFYPQSHDIIMDMWIDGVTIDFVEEQGPEQPEDGILRAIASLPNQGSRSIAVGPLVNPSDSSQIDLVTVNRDSGQIEIRPGNDRHNHFNHRVTQTLEIPGGPRAVEIVDLDLDGWNDLVVALRNFDRVITFKNENGTLSLNSEMPTGVSPREMAVADFDGNGYKDVAVINRTSADLSILTTFAGEASFSKLDQVYPTDGEVTSVILEDVNGDGRADVVQLHRSSGDVSIRFTDEQGKLGEPAYFAFGAIPSAMEFLDINNDGIGDLMAANLEAPGSVSIRLGNGSGQFEEETVYLVTDGAAVNSGLYAISAADFDGDGYLDIAAGYSDCRVAFYRGNGDGSLTYTTSQLFIYEARVMVTGDFDGDGDIDLAGAGYAGDMVVFENEGDFLTNPNITRHHYPAPSDQQFGTKGIRTLDINADGDLDLAIGSGSGVVIYLGTEGIEFELSHTLEPVYDFDDAPVSDLVTGDFDGDGQDDLAVSCRLLSCITILTRNAEGKFVPAITVDVPSGGFLAAGDLDGDGHSDLVGSGDTLWTALSSRLSGEEPYEPELSERATLGKVVINEVLPRNNDIRLEQDSGKKVDFVEIFVPSGAEQSTEGWTLRLEERNDAGGVITRDFVFPSGDASEEGHILVFFSSSIRSEYHTGYKLPGGKGTLILLDSQGEEVDRVEYPELEENVSYGRFHDGARVFVQDAIPSPGKSNKDNGPIEPILELQGMDITDLGNGRPIAFRAAGSDDVGIINVSLIYKPIGEPGAEERRAILYDDGMHGDGGMSDGSFANVIPALASGEAIQYYLEATDLSGMVVTIPDNPRFVESGEPLEMFSLGLADEVPLRISEIVAHNDSGLIDEGGGTPDYIEIENTSDTPQVLDGLSLGLSFLADASEVFTFPAGTVLDPGEFIIIFADRNLGQGDLHAPFRIDGDGDRVLLFQTGEDGSRLYVDGIDTGPLAADQALFRTPLSFGTDLWLVGTPSPYALGIDNSATGFDLALTASGEFLFYYTFATEPGKIYTPEFSESLLPGGWIELPSITGDNALHTISRTVIENKGFIRIRSTEDDQ